MPVYNWAGHPLSEKDPESNWVIANTAAATNLTNYYVNNQTWTTWNNVYTTAATITYADRIIWNDWNNTTTTGGGIYNYNFQSDRVEAVRRAVAPARTEDEWAAIRRQRDIEREDRDKVQAAARAEGGRLLAMILDPAQLASLAQDRYFDLIGSSGQRWRVHYGTSGNVKALDDTGHEFMSVCAHPRLRESMREGYLPTEDVIAAQALHLIHDDSTFLATANIHRGTRGSLSLVPALRAA